MRPDDTQQKAKAALQLLLDDTTTFTKFENIKTLLLGINPKIDKLLMSCSNVIKELKNIQEGDVVELSSRNLPEHTPEQKERKRLLLLLLSFWKDLRMEVEKVKELYQSKNEDGKITSSEHLSVLGKLAAFSKGPFGITTFIALVIAGGVMFVNSKIVSITIENRGCPPLTTPKISIPGVNLPSSITDGSPASIKLPAFKVSVDNTTGNNLAISFLSFNFKYSLGNNIEDVVFDNKSLLGKNTIINLAEAKHHSGYIQCSNP